MDMIASRREGPAGFTCGIHHSNHRGCSRPGHEASRRYPGDREVAPHSTHCQCHGPRHPQSPLVSTREIAEEGGQGKGKAVEASRNNAVAGPLGTTAMEVNRSGVHIGEPSQTSDSPPAPEGPIGESSRAIDDGDQSWRGRSRSRGHKPGKRGQSVATINSDGDGEQASSHPQPKRARPNVQDMLIPDPGYKWVEYENRCGKCVQRGQQCVAYPGKACWQCCCSKVACSFMNDV